MNPVDKLLRNVILEERKNGPVGQEAPRCTHCNLAIDLSDDSLQIEFVDVYLGGLPYTMIRPTCPGCGRPVEPKACISH